MKRCEWCGEDPLYVKYHDKEWGVPVHDDRTLFEFLVLEGAQAGLSWITILRKREGYRKAYDDFDVQKVASYDESKIEELLLNPDIVRNKLKVRSSVNNAKLFMEIQKEFGIKGKNLFMGTRVLLTGQMHGPDINKLLTLLGKDKLLIRIEEARKNL